MTVSIASINLNGIRAAARKGFDTWLDDSCVDIVLGQEVRADTPTTESLFGDQWHVANGASVLKGRAGVCIAVRKSSGLTLDNVTTTAIADQVPQDSGRWIEGVVSRDATPLLRVVSAYLHSGELNTEKMDFKYSHLDRVEKRLSALATDSLPCLVAGDFNIVHSQRDIKNWKPNHNKRAGVMDDEIAYLDRWMSDDTWVDVSRHLVGPDVQGPYTWWSWRGKAFDNDAGWRIDYQMATKTLADAATDIRVDRADAYDKRFSDHAPVVVSYDV